MEESHMTTTNSSQSYPSPTDTLVSLTKQCPGNKVNIHFKGHHVPNMSIQACQEALTQGISPGFQEKNPLLLRSIRETQTKRHFSQYFSKMMVVIVNSLCADLLC